MRNGVTGRGSDYFLDWTAGEREKIQEIELFFCLFVAGGRRYRRRNRWRKREEGMKGGQINRAIEDERPDPKGGLEKIKGVGMTRRSQEGGRSKVQ